MTGPLMDVRTCGDRQYWYRKCRVRAVQLGRLQNKLQMFAVTGRQAEESEIERFKQLGGLLFATPVTATYLMAQLRVQKLLADIFADLSKAAGIAIELPSLS